MFNLKQMAATLQYLQENDLLEYEQLKKKATEAEDRFHTLSGQIKSIKGAMSVNAELKAAKYSKKYLTGYETEIAVCRVARATFQRVLSGAKLQKMDALKEEYQ